MLAQTKMRMSCWVRQLSTQQQQLPTLLTTKNMIMQTVPLPATKGTPLLRSANKLLTVACNPNHRMSGDADMCATPNLPMQGGNGNDESGLGGGSKGENVSHTPSPKPEPKQEHPFEEITGELLDFDQNEGEAMASDLANVFSKNDNPVLEAVTRARNKQVSSLV